MYEGNRLNYNQLMLALEGETTREGAPIGRNIPLSVIQQVVADSYRISLADLLGRSRTTEFALPRQVAMYICREMTFQSFPGIAQAFGRTHATVMHAVTTVKNYLSTEARSSPIAREEVYRLQLEVLRRAEVQQPVKKI
jgi:chromosomal replication initiation ATPase DnaA